MSLLVDYGGLQATLDRLPEGAPDLSTLADRVKAFASSLGRVVSATAYADWTALGDDAVTFRRQGIEPRLVLPLESGDDRSDVVLALDAIQAALEMQGVSIYVIASVDASLHELCVRLRRMGREVVVCGPRDQTAAELLRESDRFVPFESLLGTRPEETASPETPPVPGRVLVDFAAYDWTPFLRLVNELEHRLNFVGLKYLNHKVLNKENCGFDDRARRQALINHAIDEGILQIYRIDNIEADGDPVSACRLDREHEIVREVLGAPAEETANADTTAPTTTPEVEEPAEAE